VRRITHFIYNQRVAPYIFVLPFVLTFASFFLSIPVFTTVRMSFQEILPGMITNVGLKNYQRLLGDRIFRTAVQQLRVHVLDRAILIPMPLALAYMINSKSMTAPGLFKGTVLPILTSVVVAGTIFRLIFGELGFLYEHCTGVFRPGP
jgi:arabinosaccharide transport system permease protein